MSGLRDSYRIFRTMGAAQRSALHDQWIAAQTYEPSIIVFHPKALGGAAAHSERLRPSDIEHPCRIDPVPAEGPQFSGLRARLGTADRVNESRTSWVVSGWVRVAHFGWGR